MAPYYVGSERPPVAADKDRPVSTAAPAALAESERAVESQTIRGLEAVERAVAGGVLRGWDALVEGDRTATPFQAPTWALAWYRSYHTFEPVVFVVTRGEDLVGVVPLAIERATGRLTFAGDNMTDYRDIVTHPACRRAVVRELLRFLKRGRYGLVHVGSTYPESETPALLIELAPSCGIHALLRYNYGWRWWPHEQKEDPLKKKSVRYPINFFKRHGTLVAERLCGAERWEAMKEAFYTQHTLRQLFGGRAVSFDDPQKRAFFDAIVRTEAGHVTALWHNDQLIAGHVGFVFRRILYWGAPAFDVRHRQYSPNIVLLALTMAEHERWGFDGVDLTIGKGEVKERFSTSRVDLPWVELYTGRRQFLLRQVRALSARLGRRASASVAGSPDTWDRRIHPMVEKAAFKLTRMREMGLARSVTHSAELISERTAGRRRGIVYRMNPGDLRAASAALHPGETIEIHENALEDLARRDIWDDEGARDIGWQVRIFTDGVKAGRTLHTLLVNGRLAAWGHSYWPTEPATLTEVGAVQLHFEPGSVSLYDFHTLPEFRGRKLYQALLTAILKQRFAEGAERAYITVLARNAPSRAAIERVGFRPVVVNEALWLFKWRQVRSRRL